VKIYYATKAMTNCLGWIGAWIVAAIADASGDVSPWTVWFLVVFAILMGLNSGRYAEKLRQLADAESSR